MARSLWLTGDEPLTATVVFGGQPAAIAGLCAETAFPAAQCAFNGSNTKPTCKPQRASPMPSRVRGRGHDLAVV